jgi:hypothetical protein
MLAGRRPGWRWTPKYNDYRYSGNEKQLLTLPEPDILKTI